MSNVTRRERITTEATEPTLEGGYVQRSYEAYAWRCDGCGLVWEKKHLAANCEGRGHKPRFEAGPYGRCWIENGRLMGNPVFYDRAALRREKVQPRTP